MTWRYESLTSPTAPTTDSGGRTVTCAICCPSITPPAATPTRSTTPARLSGTSPTATGDELAAVLWSHGQGYDLNTLIAPSALHLASAEYINDQGEIVGHGVLPNGDQRVFLLIANPSVPLPAVPPSAGKGSHVSTARIGPALDRNCASLWLSQAAAQAG